MRGVLVVSLALIVALLPSRATTATLDDWFSVSGLEARVGEEVITTWDLMVFLAWERLAGGAPLGAPPSAKELEGALARFLYQRILLDAATRQGVAMADADRIEARMRAARVAWGGSPALFESGTGLRWAKAREEVRRRVIVERYIQEVVLPSLQVSERAIDAEYARTATAWGNLPRETVAPSIRRALIIRALREELRRTVERFLERTPIELPGRPFKIEELLAIEPDAATSSALP